MDSATCHAFCGELPPLSRRLPFQQGRLINGTALGGALLYSGWGEAISNFRKAAEIDKSWMQRIQGEPKVFSKNDAKNLRLLYEPALFFAAVVFIGIPGIITDVLGIFLALGSVRRFLVQQSINSHVRKSNA